jgi:hypothetical protein
MRGSRRIVPTRLVVRERHPGEVASTPRHTSTGSGGYLG